MKYENFNIQTVADDAPDGRVRVSLSLNHYPFLTRWYMLSGPDRFDTAIAYTTDEVGSWLYDQLNKDAS